MKKIHSNFLKLAFNLAKINLGKTKNNPSVGCVVVKDNSVISSGFTSINGRPHAEFNALKKKINFNNSDLYTTMEPCTHFGLTAPCTDIIKRKGIKRVFYSFNDNDQRTAYKAKKILSIKRIKSKKIIIDSYKDFYNSYFAIKNKKAPFVDAKLAISKDYLTVNRHFKWITNLLSRKRTHLLRSQYDCILSTSKTINKDNALLNCRLNGFNQNKPDLIIIDINQKIKKNLDLFKRFNKRKIYIVSSVKKFRKKFFTKNQNVKFINLRSLKNKEDFECLFKILFSKGYNRILVESGLIFLNELIKFELIHNLYMFRSSIKLTKKGKNNTTSSIIKKFKLHNSIKVNLNDDKLYKIKIK